MKNRLLTMLTLVLSFVLGASAQTTLIDYPTSKDGTSIDGTTTETTVKIHTNQDPVDCYQLKNGYTTNGVCNDNYIKLETEGGFKTGDVITIAGAINNDDPSASKRATAVLFTLDEEKKATKFHQFQDFINSRLVDDDPVEESYTLENDVDTIYIGRDGNTGANLTKIQVVRPEQPEQPAAVPAITLTATEGVERTITVGLGDAGKVGVDWGDGIIVEQESAAAYDGWSNALEFTGTPAGEVKIYGEGITYLQAFTKLEEGELKSAITAIDLGNAATITELDLHQNKLATIDLTMLTALKSLTIGVNDFTDIDLSANTELASLDIRNGKLTAIDLSKNTKLTKVVLTGNQLETLDFTSNPLVKTFQVLDNQLTSVTIGENTAKGHTFQFGGNKLTTFDLSKASDLATSFVYLRDNDLSEVVLPADATVRRFWLDGNAFTLAQLYELKSKATQTFTYATTYTKEYAQVPYEIAGSLSTGETVDLSAFATLGETATVFTWKTADGTTLAEGTDYTVENGVFTFLTAQQDIHCEMTNEELNAFTAEKPYLTTTIKNVEYVSVGIDELKNADSTVVIYNLRGQRVDTPTKGLYIVRSANGRQLGKKVAVK